MERGPFCFHAASDDEMLGRSFQPPASSFQQLVAGSWQLAAENENQNSLLLPGMRRAVAEVAGPVS
jgi:hypothetical protein